MAQGWTITGGAGDATINSSGVATFPKNTGTSEITYTVTYEDANGCTVSTSYTIPTGSSCNCNCDMFDMDTSVMAFDVTGGTNTRTITSYCGVITVSSNETWATVSVSNGVISVTVTDYSGGNDPREATITVKQDGKCDKTFVVHQTANTCETINYQYTYEMSGLDFPSYGSCEHPPFYLDVQFNVYSKLPGCGDNEGNTNFRMVVSKSSDNCIDQEYDVSCDGLIYIQTQANPYEDGGRILIERNATISQNKNVPGEIYNINSVAIDLSYGRQSSGYKHNIPMTLIEHDVDGDRAEYTYKSTNTYQGENVELTIDLTVGERYTFFTLYFANLDKLPE